MARCEREKRRSEDRIEARREDLDGFSLDFELDSRALLATDPVALHSPDVRWPSIQVVDPFEQLLSVLRNPQKPLIEVALLDERVTPPAAFVLAFDLLVGENGLTGWTPVDGRLPAGNESVLVEAFEQPLVPAVVLGLAGRDFPIPIVPEAQITQLTAHSLDAFERPLLGVRSPFDSGVLGGEAEGIPPHRMEDLVPAHPLESGEGVRDGVVTDVAHVEFAGRIGKHPENVRWVGHIVRCSENACFPPDALPALLEYRVVVLLSFLHTSRRW